MAVLTAGETLKLSYSHRRTVASDVARGVRLALPKRAHHRRHYDVLSTWATRAAHAADREAAEHSIVRVHASVARTAYDDAVEEPKEMIRRVKHFTGTFCACMCLYKVTTPLGTKQFSQLSTLTSRSRSLQHHRRTSFGRTKRDSARPFVKRTIANKFTNDYGRV
ncbi:hypothetical protein BKA62DRAFT_362047 [Auriculariales sp. MPI-PUGE-AT-0066]|nr:hypothetical protein BKA62DRAFT_362047 [Auriculariales sp. MPI-PUGE-AT-0066]